jgi:hypothetical protein
LCDLSPARRVRDACPAQSFLFCWMSRPRAKRFCDTLRRYAESINVRVKGIVITSDCDHAGCCRCSCTRSVTRQRASEPCSHTRPRIIAAAAPAVRALAHGLRLQNMHISCLQRAHSGSPSPCQPLPAPPAAAVSRRALQAATAWPLAPLPSSSATASCAPRRLQKEAVYLSSNANLRTLVKIASFCPTQRPQSSQTAS